MYYVLERKDVLSVFPYIFNSKEELRDFVKFSLYQSDYILQKLDKWLNKTKVNDCKAFSSFSIYAKVK